MVPSSPNGPCRIGKTTSTSVRVPSSATIARSPGSRASATPGPLSAVTAGRAPPAAAGAGSASTRCQRPALSMPTVTTSNRSGSRASSTERAEMTETSCSAERPPKMTRTRRRGAGAPPPPVSVTRPPAPGRSPPPGRPGPPRRPPPGSDLRRCRPPRVPRPTAAGDVVPGCVTRSTGRRTTSPRWRCAATWPTARRRHPSRNEKDSVAPYRPRSNRSTQRVIGVRRQAE